MNLEEVEKLIELMRRYNVGEIEVSSDKTKIRVSSMPTNASHGFGTFGMTTAQPMHPNFVHAAHGGPATFADTLAAGSAVIARGSAPAAAASGGAGAALPPPGKLVRSPFVGTFYLAPSPGADPFVSVGQRVKKGDTLCIVEAMKYMNPIEAEFSGVLREVLAHNGQPVEFEQPLFVIEEM